MATRSAETLKVQSFQGPERALDHFVQVCNDISKGAEAYTKLGFHVRPIAKHVEIGSSNCVIHFENTYMELIDLTHANEEMKGPYMDRFKCGEGLAHVSLTSSNLVADHKWAVSNGLDPLPIWSARRKIIRPDGTEDHTDSDFFYMWRPESRYMSLFLSGHKKPDAIFIKEYENHENTATDVNKIVYMSADPQSDISYFSKLFGKEPEITDDGFRTIGTRGEITEVVTPSAAVSRYGRNISCTTPDPLAGFVVAMHYSVRSLDACSETLVKSSVPFGKQGAAIIVPASEICGCAIVFE